MNLSHFTVLLQLMSLVEDSFVTSQTLKSKGTPFARAAAKLAARDLVRVTCGASLVCLCVCVSLFLTLSLSLSLSLLLHRHTYTH